MNDPAGVAQATQWVLDHLVLAVLILTRLSLLLMAMPAVGVGVPRRVRAMLAIVMTMLLLAPVANQMTSDSGLGGGLPAYGNLTELTIAMGREALIGMLIGATVQLIVTGFQIGGELMSGTGGMQLGDSIDPTVGVSVPATARLIGMMVTAIFLLVGGHRLLLGLLVDSFDSMPAGRVRFDSPMMDVILDQLAAGMVAGVRIAAPVVAALLLANLVTGLVSRTLPQINVLAIGLSVNALTLLLVLALSLSSIGFVFQDEMAAALDRIGMLF
ncbi:MAG: flagellar biosynthetic protein FliR [Planctomycetota bacterium]